MTSPFYGPFSVLLHSWKLRSISHCIPTIVYYAIGAYCWTGRNCAHVEEHLEYR